MQLLHIVVWIGDAWQRVVRLGDYKPPKDGSWYDDLTNELETFLGANPGTFWIATADSPHGVFFGPEVPRLFHLTPPVSAPEPRKPGRPPGLSRIQPASRRVGGACPSEVSDGAANAVQRAGPTHRAGL